MSRNFIKYLFIHAETFIMLLSFVIGTLLAGAGAYLLGLALVILPFVYGNLVNFEKHLDFIEIYERALTIKSLK